MLDWPSGKVDGLAVAAQVADWLTCQWQEV